MTFSVIQKWEEVIKTVVQAVLRTRIFLRQYFQRLPYPINVLSWICPYISAWLNLYLLLSPFVYPKVLRSYRDAKGRPIPLSFIPNREGRMLWWTWPLKRDRISYLLESIAATFDKTQRFIYVEFGVCFGTTFASVLSKFPNAIGIGFEYDCRRYDIARYVVKEVIKDQSRYYLHRGNVTEYHFEPQSIDVVFMDTGHLYPDDYNFTKMFVAEGVLRSGGLFIGDDAMHSGTKRSRERFEREYGDIHKVMIENNFWLLTQK